MHSPKTLFYYVETKLPAEETKLPSIHIEAAFSFHKWLLINVLKSFNVRWHTNSLINKVFQSKKFKNKKFRWIRHQTLMGSISTLPPQYSASDKNPS
jgi:hypothetical protein